MSGILSQTVKQVQADEEVLAIYFTVQLPNSHFVCMFACNE